MSYLSYHEGGPPSGGGAFQSLTEALDPTPTIVPKQHFIETFSGDALDSIWTVNDFTGTGSGAMLDSVNGGYQLTSGTGFFDVINIDHNGIDHYEETGCIMKTVVKIDSTTANQERVGFANQTIGSPHWIIYLNNAAATNLQLQTDGGSTTTTDSSIAIDTATHKVELELRSASATLFIDSVLEVLNTTNLPTQPLQPNFSMLGQAGSGKTGHISYMECFNT